MIYSGLAHIFIIWMTIQLIITQITATLNLPYTSEFSYTPAHHPSENPSCPTRKSNKIRNSQDDKYFIIANRKHNADNIRKNEVSSVEIIAMLLPCTHPPNGSINSTETSFSYSHHQPNSKITKCHGKLIISIKLTNIGETDTGDRFIVIDHVTDPLTMRKSRLMDPYVIKIRQEQILQLYAMNFQSVVNAEATEDVINNEKQDFSGCDDYSDHPTCGEMYYKGVKIPHSQGFCCSCDTDSPFQLHHNETASAPGPQFHHKRFRDDTKSIGKLLEGLQSHRMYSTALPSRLKAKKYLDVGEISSQVPHVQWESVDLVDVKKKSKITSKIPMDVEQFSRREESRHINRRNWSKKRLNRLRGMLMKSHVRNNENYVRDSASSTDSYHVPSPYISPVMRNFFYPNISTTTRMKYQPHGQSLEIKLHDADVEKTSQVQPLNWKIPIGQQVSFISPDEDLRYLEKQLRSLPSVTKIVDTTVSEITYKPRIVIDRFKIRSNVDSDEKMVKRKLLNYVNKNYLQSSRILNPGRIKKTENTKNPRARDFAISLTGKIHIDGGANGGPMSITFDTSPGAANLNNPPLPLDQLKINRRSVENMEIPYEIIPRPHHRDTSNKITRSEFSKAYQHSIKNLISNELPQMDAKVLEAVTTMPGRIRPYSLPEEPTLPPPTAPKIPETVVQPSAENPVNLKIIGLISMSNPRAEKIEVKPHQKTNKNWLGELEIVPLIHVKVETESSVTPPQETNVKTPGKPSCPFGMETTVQSAKQFFTSRMNTKSPDDIPETVTFYVDSDDVDSSEPNYISGEKNKMHICPFDNNFSPTETINEPKVLNNNKYPLVIDGNEEMAPMNHTFKLIQIENNSRSNEAVTERNHFPLEEKPNHSDNNEDTRLNNMLAIMEFINKLKRVLTGDEPCPNDEPGTVIRLQKFVITPENSSNTENRIFDDVSTERMINTFENSSNEFARENSTNSTDMNDTVRGPKQTYITRIIKKPTNVGGQTLETLRDKLIDKYLESVDDSKERQASEIFRDPLALNSKGAFENNRQVESREIVHSDSRLLRKEVRRKRKKKRKKKKKKLKKWLPFKRQLMSLDVEDVLEEIYDDNDESDKIEYNIKRMKCDRGETTGALRNRENRKKREISASGFQIRGGQNCMDRRHPPNVNPAKYLESAHCLRFSDLWYSVYKLEKPIVEHTVYIQLFKRERENMQWKDLTRGEMIRLGTFTRHQRDKIPTIVFTYTQEKSEIPEFNLNPNTQRLLIPLTENIDKKSGEKTSEGMYEYLIIPSSQITSEGRECDKAGVGFSAFVMQKDRCTRKRDSCLRNQPLSYWRHDMRARKSGQPGCYFLSNFATVPVNPIKYNVTDVSGRGEYLALVQTTHHVSTLEIEVRADDNSVISTGSAARITEVHVDATSMEKKNLSIRLTNTGLVSSDYRARIVGCPSGLPTSWAHAITQKQLIPPQHDSLLTLTLPGQVIIDSYECTVEVINYRGELVAARRIIVHKMNRCFCLWHCVCMCYKSPHGFSCLPMTPEHYHAAGFRGQVPTINPRTFEFWKISIDVLLIIIIIFFIFLIIGIVKWIIGVVSPPIGRWGMDNLLAGWRIEEYFEADLKCRCIVTDDEGIPIHPDTGRRTVRICSRPVEFIINSLFLFIYPSCVICDCMGKILKCRENGHRDDSKDRLIDKENPRMISVRSYGDTRHSKLEQEDTNYVITELKRSQVSLQDFSNKSKNNT